MDLKTAEVQIKACLGGADRTVGPMRACLTEDYRLTAVLETRDRPHHGPADSTRAIRPPRSTDTNIAADSVGTR